MWRCKSKHEWSATPNDIINNKSGCPECRYHKNEAKIKFIFEEYFEAEFRKKSKIKTNSGKLIELDGYNSSLQLAFEYDGIQHYKYVPFFHKNNIANFKIQQLSDSLKTEYCKENGFRYLQPSIMYFADSEVEKKEVELHKLMLKSQNKNNNDNEDNLEELESEDEESESENENEIEN